MELVIGENLIFEVPVVDINDDPLPIADLYGLRVEIIQYGRVKGDFKLKPLDEGETADDELRVNPDTATSFDFELTKSLSSTLIKGELWMKIYLAKTDADFMVDDDWTDIDTIKLADMI